jgi:hypothetical protein
MSYDAEILVYLETMGTYLKILLIRRLFWDIVSFSCGLMFRGQGFKES